MFVSSFRIVNSSDQTTRGCKKEQLNPKTALYFQREASRRLQMKRLFILLTLAAFVLSAPFVMAQTDTAAPGAKATPEKSAKINCCNKGQCKQVGSELDCTKDGGKVVKDCKECK
jgi:hypothetical protein